MAKKGLGKGYEALFGMNELEEVERSVVTPAEKALRAAVDDVSQIDISEIDPNYEQPRKKFDSVALNEMADSIREHGVIQPIVLVKQGRRFMIIAGERRWRASKIAGLKTIPAVVRNYTQQQIKEISLVENLQREDLNAIETARAIKRLMDECNMTQETVADRIGKSRSAVANTLRLLALNAEVMTLVEDDRLSAGHARALVPVGNEKDQLALARKICAGELSVRDAEKLVKNYFNPKPEKSEVAIEQSLELKELVTGMQRVFATKVSAVGNDRKGRIYIDYFTKDDLDRICALVDRLHEN